MVNAAELETEGTTPKREAILGAALELFASRGFHGTAVPLVAARAGVGAGTIYRYFESKEALVNVLFRRWKRAMGLFVARSMDFKAPFRDQFRASWQGLGRFALQQPTAFTFLELHHHATYLDDESRQVLDATHQPFVAMVRRAQAAGIIRPVNPEILLALVYGTLVGLMVFHRDDHLPLTEAVLAESEPVVWSALAAQQDG